MHCPVEVEPFAGPAGRTVGRRAGGRRQARRGKARLPAQVGSDRLEVGLGPVRVEIAEDGQQRLDDPFLREPVRFRAVEVVARGDDDLDLPTVADALGQPGIGQSRLRGVEDEEPLGLGIRIEADGGVASAARHVAAGDAAAHDILPEFDRVGCPREPASQTHDRDVEH